ncbi:MAG: hypothetical protein FWH03_05175 [Firmicutes bacterium]|nr:hypothetical protein [Bacillota bacterium]
MAEENTIKAGRISGDPTRGLCERVVIEVQRVYDGCITRIPSKTFVLRLDDIEPPGLKPPFTYVSAESSGAAEFRDVSVTPLSEGRSRIEGDVIIPITVHFTDSYGRRGTGISTVTVHRDVVLHTPARSLVPFRVTTQATLASDIGSFISEDTVNIVCCIVLITKIIVPTDIVIPCYGRGVYPDCGQTEEDVCTRLLNTPVFPPLD